jgi:hypothetical protein
MERQDCEWWIGMDVATFKVISLQWLRKNMHQYFKFQPCSECFFLPMPPTFPLWTSWSPLPVVAEVEPTSEFGTSMRRSYVVPMSWMVILEYEVPAGALNLSSTELPRQWSPWESSPWRKNPHGSTGNRTRNLSWTAVLWTYENDF